MLISYVLASIVDSVESRIGIKLLRVLATYFRKYLKFDPSNVQPYLILPLLKREHLLIQKRPRSASKHRSANLLKRQPTPNPDPPNFTFISL